MESNCKSQIETLFDYGIYDGAGIIKYIGNLEDEEQAQKLTELGLNETMIKKIIVAHKQE
jgi:hypothetical protein